MIKQNITKGEEKMSGSIVWPILTFLVGGAFGLLAGIKLVRSDYEKKIDQLEDDNDFLNEELNKAMDREERLVEKYSKDLDDSLSGVSGVDIDDLEDERIGKRLARRYGDKTPYSRGYPYLHDYRPDDQTPTDDPPYQEPFEITEEQFMSDFRDSQNESLNYYAVDRVLTDEHDEPINNPVEVVGAFIYESLDLETADVMYIHNDALDTNYEIIIEHSLGYRRDVLGLIDGDDEEADES